MDLSELTPEHRARALYLLSLILDWYRQQPPFTTLSEAIAAARNRKAAT